MKKSLTTSELFPISPDVAAEHDTRRRRLHYRSWHRGCKETDIVLGNFADQALSTLAGDELDVYERLLEEDDADIWEWLSSKTTPPDEYAALIARLKQYGLPR